jgi:Na+/proline symporter
MFSVAAFIIVKAAFLPEHSAVIAAAGAGWADVTPRWTADPMYWLDNPLIYQMFGISILFWVAKSMIEGLGGHTGYMAQRYFAARDERSAGLMTAEWTLLLSARFAMVAGVALLGLWLAQQSPAIAGQLEADPERTLPVVFSHILPAGVLGFALAGMISAAMSTFDSTINAGASYWVRDIYQRFLRPEADEKALVRQSYLATVTIALVGVVLAMAIRNINEIWNLLTGPLGTAFVVPMALRWYWWRFNGYGFAWSIGVGMLTAILMDVFVPGLAFFLATAITFVISVTIGVAVSLLTPAPDDQVLRRFYRQIRPFGWWGRFAGELDETESDSIRSENRLGLMNMMIALAWQLCLFITVIAAVWHNWQAMYPALAALFVLSVALYFFWYRNLSATGVGQDDQCATGRNE